MDFDLLPATTWSVAAAAAIGLLDITAIALFEDDYATHSLGLR